MSERFSQIFEIALVLLGLFATAEYEFFKEIWGSQYAFSLVTSPIVVIIVVWLLKEISKDMISIERWLLLTEFSWSLWVITLGYYSFYWWFIRLPDPNFGIIGAISLSIVSVGIDWLIKNALHQRYRTVISFYKSKKWLSLRLFLLAVAITMLFLLFNVFPPPTVASS